MAFVYMVEQDPVYLYIQGCESQTSFAGFPMDTIRRYAARSIARQLLNTGQGGVAEARITNNFKSRQLTAAAVNEYFQQRHVASIEAALVGRRTFRFAFTRWQLVNPPA